jgi:hypothetical protein
LVIKKSLLRNLAQELELNTVHLFNVVDEAKVRRDAGNFVTAGKKRKKIKPRRPVPDGTG